ncbi:MAG TPA: uroporphyrinogen decarboxylase family protein [Spirochaetia bacterium]|nr:uroporphyrinogen decarboxylase family protein [Spirochaetia bacterium]
MDMTLPLKHPKPDSSYFLDVVMGRRSGPSPLVEYLVDDVVMKPIVEGLLGREWAGEGSVGTAHEVRRGVVDRAAQTRYLDTYIDFWLRMGYDFVRFERDVGFPERHLETSDTAPGSAKRRAWSDQHTGSIMSWKDYEKYPWPRLESFDFFPFEYINSHLPDGMGMITCHGGGLYEHLSWIMSYEGLCLALYDAPDLVKAVAERVGSLLVGFYRHLLDLDRVIAIFQGDDMGFKTGTLLAPEALRTYCLPWQRRLAAMSHERGRPYFLHSCGNLASIMEDLIEDVRIDGKHSYENTIMPVTEFQQKYGTRIAVLGGLDINILTRSTPQEIRKQTANLIEVCGAHGRYAVGSGNSVPSYIPVENYLAMVDEAVKRRGLS